MLWPGTSLYLKSSEVIYRITEESGSWPRVNFQARPQVRTKTFPGKPPRESGPPHPRPVVQQSILRSEGSCRHGRSGPSHPDRPCHTYICIPGLNTCIPGFLRGSNLGPFQSTSADTPYPRSLADMSPHSASVTRTFSTPSPPPTSSSLAPWSRTQQQPLHQ